MKKNIIKREYPVNLHWCPNIFKEMHLFDKNNIFRGKIKKLK